MPDVIRWLHLSDLHFSLSQSYDSNIVLEALLRDLPSIVDSKFLPVDLIFATGDIAYSGSQGEYDLAAKFFNKLLSTLNAPKDRLYLVPGNHDVDRNRIGISSAINAYMAGDLTPVELRARMAILLSDSEGRSLILRRLAGYSDFINDYLASHLNFSDKEFFYTKKVKVGGVELAIYGLNSAWFCTSDSDQNRLVIGERQAREAINQSTKAALRIALVHHPFDWLMEFDRNDSEDFLIQNCDFILHGHRHKQAFRQEKRPSGEPFIFASGAGYDRRALPNSCNLVRIDLGSGHGAALSLRYSDEGGGFWSCDTQSDPGLKLGIYKFDRGNPYVSEISTATQVPEAKDALLASPSDYIEYIKNTGQLYAVSSDDLLEIATLSPTDTVNLLEWLTAQNSSLVNDLVAKTGSKLEQALSRSPVDLNKFFDLRNKLVHGTGITTKATQERSTLLALGVPGGELSQQMTLQIPRKDPSQPLRAEQLAFSIYLVIPTSQSIWNPKISLSVSARSLSYPYRGGGFVIEPPEYWRVSKPTADSVRCLFSLPQGSGKDFSERENPVIGTVKMLIPWGEADNGPVDLNFAYQIEDDKLVTVRGDFRISVIAALTFETASEANRFQVPANRKEGIDTKLYIQQGQILRFATEGIVSLDSRHHFVNADGYLCDEVGRLDQPAQRYASTGELLNGQRAGVVLGWLGDWEDGKAFYIGSTNTIVAESEGILHLAVNDLLNAYEDNSGDFTVLVQIE